MVDQLAIGDSVQLKTGGPEMTVTKIETGTYSGQRMTMITCRWFWNGDFKQDQFPIEALRKVT